MRTYLYPITIKPLEDQDGFYAECPVVQGAHTTGETPEQAIFNLQDAIKAILEFKKSRTLTNVPVFNKTAKLYNFNVPVTV